MEAHKRTSPFLRRLSVKISVPAGTRTSGSPSSSTSCHHAQLHFDRVLNAAQASSGITNNYEQAERPLPVRKRHSRKPARAEPMLPAATFHEAAALEEPKEDLAAQPPSEDRRSRHKPKKMWEEEDFREPGPRAGRKKVQSGPAPRGDPSKDAAARADPSQGAAPRGDSAQGAAPRGDPSQSAALVAQPQQADAHSPLSEDSAGTRKAFSPRAAEHRLSSLDAASQEEDEEEPQQKGNVKLGGPCYVCWATESAAWRAGKDVGLFPGRTLCNSHGTLDRRHRLWKYVDDEAIIGLHESDMTDEEKAAASKQYYRKGKAARKSPFKVHRTRVAASEEVSDEAGAGAGAGGNARGRGNSNAEAASWQGRTGPSQPWSAQSPSGDKAAGQAARGRKRKAASSDGDDAAAAAPAMQSQKRLCFQKQTEPAVSAGRDDSSNEELSDSDVDDLMDIDSMAESLSGIDAEMGSAVAGLLSMRRSGSADMHNFAL